MKLQHTLAAALLAVSAFAQAQTSFYNVGNSFSDHLSGTPNIGLSLGHSFDWGRHMIPGSSLNFIYQNPNSGFGDQGYYDEALPGKAWDIVSLQPWNESITTFSTTAISMAALAYQGNPDATIVVLATSGLSLLNYTNPGDFYASFNALGTNNSGARAYFEQAVDDLRAAYPGKTIGLIPVQHVLAELDRRLAEGETIPEVASLDDILDATQHFNSRGRYLACLIAYATVVRQSPVGAMSGNFTSNHAVSAQFAAYAQQLAWDVVQAEPYAALVKDGGVPTANIQATILRGTAPLSVTFSAVASTDSDGTIVGYEWDFGNGNTSTSANGSETYNAGVYPVTLTVRDNDGKTASTTVYVQASGESVDPIALEAECATVGANWSVVSTDFASLGTALTAAPGFNNTSNITAPSGIDDRVTFTFEVPTAGAYTIHARVNAPTGSDDSFWVRVNGGNWFVWNNIGINSPAFIWSALPGTYNLPAGEVTIDFAYREDGTALDKLQLTTSTNVPSGMGLPSVNCFYDEEAPTVPTNLTSSNLLVNGVSLSWNAATDNIGVSAYQILRDGLPVGTTQQTSFDSTGLAPSTTYLFSITALDEAGNVSAASEPHQVTTPANNAPMAVISATATEGSVPLTITFAGGNSTDPDAGDLVIGYEWDFGNGPEGGSVNEITYTFEQAGRYVVTLTVIDLFDLPDTTTMEIIVRDPQAILDWRMTHFGTTSNSGDAADSEDPDFDGQINLIEYALNRDPKMPDTAGALVIDPEAMELRFERARAELNYEIESSADLESWNTLTINPGTPETTVSVPFDLTSGTQFFRLRISIF